MASPPKAKSIPLYKRDKKKKLDLHEHRKQISCKVMKSVKPNIIYSGRRGRFLI